MFQYLDRDLYSSRFYIDMRLFDLAEIEPKSPPYKKLQKQASELIREICMMEEISITAMHAALWVFHCNAIVMGYQKFDRFIYSAAAVLVGTKLMECLRYPTKILASCRKILRKKKGIESDQDSEQFLKRQIKNVFEAEVTILLNIGFDFDLKLAITEAEFLKLHQIYSIDDVQTKLKQTLTSLYCSDIVVFYEPLTLAILALLIVIKSENRNIDSLELEPSIKGLITSSAVQTAYKDFFIKYQCN